jgi:hypothetical protein
VNPFATVVAITRTGHTVLASGKLVMVHWTTTRLKCDKLAGLLLIIVVQIAEKLLILISNFVKDSSVRETNVWTNYIIISLFVARCR